MYLEPNVYEQNTARASLGPRITCCTYFAGVNIEIEHGKGRSVKHVGGVHKEEYNLACLCAAKVG